MCEQTDYVSVREKKKDLVVEGVGSLPVSCTAVSLGEAWLPRASELGFSPPAIESGSHCRLSVLWFAGLKLHILTAKEK